MKYAIENGQLVITADEATILELIELRTEKPEFFASDRAMHDAFEDLIANSDLDWVEPEYIGALTAAPILGIYGETVPSDKAPHARPVGGWHDEDGVYRHWVDPVESAWAFMDYVLRSPLEDLIENGKVIFVGG